jgi:hypothetical protein
LARIPRAGGRHNREYNRHELALLLDYRGFDIDIGSPLITCSGLWRDHDNIGGFLRICSIFPHELALALIDSHTRNGGLVLHLSPMGYR